MHNSSIVYIEYTVKANLNSKLKALFHSLTKTPKNTLLAPSHLIWNFYCMTPYLFDILEEIKPLNYFFSILFFNFFNDTSASKKTKNESETKQVYHKYVQ